MTEPAPRVSLPFAAKITGTGSAFPAREVSNDELAARLAKDGVETNDQWIRERTGIQTRRLSDPLNIAERNSSLGLLAAQRAMEMAGKRPEDIEQIIYATCTPDTIIPSTACWLQKKLGAKTAWGMDINAACSGFVFGLSTAQKYIETGDAKTTLVVGADILSSFTNWTDRGSSILFGDGAGAAVLEQVPVDSESKIFSCHMRSDGELWDYFFIEAGGSNKEVDAEVIANKHHKMEMKGREIFKVAVRELAHYCKVALEANGKHIDEVAWVVPHQANLRIIEATAKRLKFPMEKVLVNIDRFGNTSSATVPTTFDEAVRSGKVKRGDLILFTVFGAGLTYGSALIRW